MSDQGEKGSDCPSPALEDHFRAAADNTNSSPRQLSSTGAPSTFQVNDMLLLPGLSRRTTASLTDDSGCTALGLSSAASQDPGQRRSIIFGASIPGRCTELASGQRRRSMTGIEEGAMTAGLALTTPTEYADEKRSPSAGHTPGLICLARQTKFSKLVLVETRAGCRGGDGTRRATQTPSLSESAAKLSSQMLLSDSTQIHCGAPLLDRINSVECHHVTNDEAECTDSQNTTRSRDPGSTGSRHHCPGAEAAEIENSGINHEYNSPPTPSINEESAGLGNTKLVEPTPEHGSGSEEKSATDCQQTPHPAAFLLKDPNKRVVRFSEREPTVHEYEMPIYEVTPSDVEAQRRWESKQYDVYEDPDDDDDPDEIACVVHAPEGSTFIPLIPNRRLLEYYQMENRHYKS